MNHKEKFICDLFMIHYSDGEKFGHTVRINFLTEHLPNTRNMSHKELDILADEVVLNGKEFRNQVNKLYKSLKKSDDAIKKTWFIISDKQKIIGYDKSLIRTLWNYMLFYWDIITNFDNYDFKYMDKSIFITKGCFNAARALGQDPSDLIENFLGVYFENN